MPNRKTDTNNNFAFSTDYIGGNYDYPDGDYAEREKIVADHIVLPAGADVDAGQSPARAAEGAGRVPAAGPGEGRVRRQRQLADAALCPRSAADDRPLRDDRAQLPRQAKLRPIRSAWPPTRMDSHNCQRYVTPDGHVQNEGDVQVGGFTPYPISYRAIVPEARRMHELLVPVAMSSSHIAYGSIRMEPVFMILGQSAATAAAHGDRCKRDGARCRLRAAEEQTACGQAGTRFGDGNKRIKSHAEIAEDRRDFWNTNLH